MIKAIISAFKVFQCVATHRYKSVVRGYSNRTSRWKCKDCGREWDD